MQCEVINCHVGRHVDSIRLKNGNYGVLSEHILTFLKDVFFFSFFTRIEWGKWQSAMSTSIRNIYSRYKYVTSYEVVMYRREPIQNTRARFFVCLKIIWQIVKVLELLAFVECIRGWFEWRCRNVMNYSDSFQFEFYCKMTCLTR